MESSHRTPSMISGGQNHILGGFTKVDVASSWLMAVTLPVLWSDSANGSARDQKLLQPSCYCGLESIGTVFKSIEQDMTARAVERMTSDSAVSLS